MSENKDVEDIYADKMYMHNYALPVSTGSSESVMHQNADIRENHDFAYSQPDTVGARPKQYTCTSTPVKFTPEDSVFSHTVEQPESKSKIEFLMQQQLEKINSVTKQYDKIASAFEDALSLYDDNEVGLSVNSIEDIKPALSAGTSKHPESKPAPIVKFHSPAMVDGSQYHKAANDECKTIASSLKLQSDIPGIYNNATQMHSTQVYNTHSKHSSVIPLTANVDIKNTEQQSHLGSQTTKSLGKPSQSSKPNVTLATQNMNTYCPANDQMHVGVQINKENQLTSDYSMYSMSNNNQPHSNGVSNSMCNTYKVMQSSNVNMLSTQPLYTTSNLYHASGCNNNIAPPLACFTSSQHQPLYTTSSLYHASDGNVPPLACFTSSHHQPLYTTSSLYHASDGNVPPSACFTSSQHQPLYTTSSLYHASGCNDRTVPPLTCLSYSTPSLRSTNVTSANPLCITSNTPPIGSNITQSQGPLQFKRKEKEPDKFDGRNVEWRDYIVHFEKVAMWNNWHDSEKAQQLAMCLRGQAQKLLGQLRPSELNDFEQLKRVLTQRYDPQERSVAYRCEFRSRKRQKNESPSDFAYALRRLVSLAFPEMPYDCREINVLEQYLSTLGTSELKEHVIFKNQKSVDEAIAYTVEYEAVKGCQFFPSKPANQQEEGYVQAIKHNTSMAEQTSYNQSDLNKLIQTLNESVEKWNQTLQKLSRANTNRSRKRQLDYSNYTCFNCEETGHIARNCPNKTKQNNRQSTPKSEN